MDKYLVSLAFLLLFLEAGWLYHDIQNPYSASTQNELNQIPLGKILKSRSQVRKKAQDSLIWEETKTEQNLFAFDSVLTLNQSAAEIALQGDSHISMNENTLVVIEPPRSGEADGPLRLRFKKGNLSARSGRNPQSVETEEFVVEAANDTKMNIRTTEDNKIQIDALEGKVKLLHPQTLDVAKTISAGESAKVNDGKIDVEKVAQIKWNIPIDGHRIYTHTEQAEVNFSWVGQINGLNVRGKDTDEELVVDIHQAQSSYKLKLPHGPYLAKLISNNAATFERQIAIWPAPKIYLVNPVVRQRFKKDTPIEFLWTQTKDVEQYVFELALDEEFKKVIKQIKTTKMGVEVNVSAVGEFFWRVRGLDSSGFEIPEMYYNNFFVLDKPLQAPKLKSPKVIRDDGNASNINNNKNQKFSILFQKSIKFIFNLIIPQAEARKPNSAKPAKNYFAEFQWEPVEGANSYVVEISRSLDFRDLVAAAHVKRESYKWKNFELGQYYWRVAGRDITGEQGLFSETAYADLNQIPQGPVKPVAPPPVVAKKPSEEELKIEAPPPKVEAAPVVIKPKEQEVDYSHEPWNFKIEGGGFATISLQRGIDFRSKLFGVGVWNARATIRPPEHNFSFWHLEFEARSLTAVGSPESQFPFQGKTSTIAMRGTFIKNDSWGIVAGQFPLFKRADLEALTYYTPLAAGLMKQWIVDKRKYRLLFVGGENFVLEGSGQQSWPLFSTVDITAEARLQTGYSLNKDLWHDLTIYLWLGWSF